jgi:hypothetical protein
LIGLQSFPYLSDLVEEFLLGLSGSDFYETPGLDDEILDVSPDPPDGVRDESIPLVGIKLLDGHHQANIPFLDQIKHLDVIRFVFESDLDNKPKICCNQFVRGLDVVGLAISRCELEFLFRRQKWELINSREIGF